eukprot:CAMPEP_0194210222 /NCGR_PEP_ID=MMETSP0156-20130528/8101_1 /TAXON_ID=33649 /ORGANISM="Thalassionema nitzschioides, Strain L26-B" /LENGTH=622 /DNA_ID=CAMNT_0038937541 /DNA_START=220 /DNA_END=2088 /DNA_ORIENTATION=+
MIIRANNNDDDTNDGDDKKKSDDDEEEDRDSMRDLINKMIANGGVQTIELDEYGNVINDNNGDADNNNNNNDDDDSCLEALLSFDLKPREVVEYLDRFVISQTDAKKVLAVAICDHYNHCRRSLEQEQKQQQQNQSSQKEDELLAKLPDVNNDSSSSSFSFDYAKPNVLLAGPTGVGKTYLLKCLARLVGVPFVKADATKFSETGIVGRDAEDLVRDLVDQANGNTTLASVGIIYLDEVDKIAGGGGESGADFTGRFNTKGVQNNFLKLLEDTEVSLDRQGDMMMVGNVFGGQNNNKPKSISTKNILFIFSGAFTSLDKELKRKKEQKSFGLDLTQTTGNANNAAGFSSDDNNSSSKKKKSYLRFAETADFIRTGLEPEFVGRVPVRVALDALDAEDLTEILTASEGSVLKQFVRDMEGYGISMQVTDDALQEVAQRAEKEETGARGLVTILEQTLRQHKYELPSTSLTKFVLDKDTVLDPEQTLQRLLDEQTSSYEVNRGVPLRDLKRWEDKINRMLPGDAEVRTWLTDDAKDYLILQCLETHVSAYSFATRHFGEDTLALMIRRVHEATSQKSFPITLEVAKNPKAELQKWLDLLETTTMTSEAATTAATAASTKKKKQR